MNEYQGSTPEELKARIAFLESLLGAFFSGDAPECSTLEHLVLAKWGRVRLEELKKTPALFNSK